MGAWMTEPTPNARFTKVSRPCAVWLGAHPVPHNGRTPLELVPPRPTLILYVGEFGADKGNWDNWMYMDLDPDAVRMA